MVKYTTTMAFKVSYRGKDGKQTSTVIEAESRAKLFAELQKRGISAIRVEETTAKAKKAKPATPAARKPSPLRGLFAGVVVIALAAAAWYYLLPAIEQVKAKREKKSTRIAEATPELAGQDDGTQQVLPIIEEKLPFWEQANTNGFTEMQVRKWRAHHMPPPAYTNDSALYESRLPYEIFDHPSENKIAFYLVHEPGEGLVGTPTFGHRFINDFLKSLEHPIIVTKDDSPEEAQLKRDMIEIKIELKQRMDAGEDLAEIMLETHNEYQRLAQYKYDIEKELQAFRKRDDVTIEDVDDFVAAANMLLDAKGIAPISLSPIARRMLMRRAGIQAE